MEVNLKSKNLVGMPVDIITYSSLAYVLAHLIMFTVLSIIFNIFFNDSNAVPH